MHAAAQRGGVREGVDFMSSFKQKAKRLLGLGLSLCLAVTAVQTAFVAGAAETLPEYPEISLPEVTTENGLLWYTFDESEAPVKNAIQGGESRDSEELYGDFKPGEGVDGGAFAFNGSSNHISINKDSASADKFLQDTYAEETVAFWFKPAKLEGIQMLYNQGGSVGGIGIRLNDDKLQVNVSTGQPNLLDDVDVSGSLNTWTHLAVVFDKGQASLYVNGVLKTGKATSANQLGAAARGTTIGNNHTRANAWDNGDNLRYYEGMMDDLRIYKAAIVPQVTVQGVTGYADIIVPAGTVENAIGLPSSLTVQLSSSAGASVPVTWVSSPAYDGNAPGDYTFTADLDLADNMLYSGQVQVKVTVEEATGEDPVVPVDPQPMPDLDTLPDYPDIRLPAITAENGLLWYTLDNTSGKPTNAIEGGEEQTAHEVIGAWKPEDGVDGGAIQFSGNNYQHITINADGSSPSFLKEAYEEETVSFWYKPDRLSGIQMLYAQGDAKGGIHIRLNETNLEASVSTGSANFLEAVDVSDSLGRWTHVALVFGEGKASLYINGEGKASVETAGDALGTTTMGTTIGNNHTRANPWDNGSSTREFQGMMDDLRIYKVAVTPEAYVRAFGGYDAEKAVLAGTSEEDLFLPSTVTAYLSSEQTLSVPVTGWASSPAYNGDEAGVYTFTAGLSLPSYLINPFAVQVKVTVQADTGEGDPELDLAVTKAQEALSGFTASKATTGQDILDAVNLAIDNPNVSVAWESDPVITLPEALESGSIVGALVLTKGKYSEKIDVDILIPSLEDGIRLRYEFEDGKAVDVSGNGRDGKTYGTLKTVDGVNGDAMYFSGGYVKMPEDIIQDLTNFSISVWIDPLSDFQYARVWDIGSGENNFFNLWLHDDTSRKYSVNIRLNESTTLRNPADVATFATGTWRNLVVTYDEADNGRITIYEDGQVIGSSQTGKKLTDLGPATNALLGWAQTKNDYDYHGYMDDFRVYDRTLTAEEVEALAAEGTQSLVKSAADALDIAAFNGFTELTGVVQDLSLPTASDIKYSGAEISWDTSAPAVITAAGEIGDVDSDTTATLTATLTRDGKSAQKAFPLTVKADRTMTPDAVPEVVTVPGLYPDLPQRIAANEGEASMDVTWETPDPSDYAGAGSFTVKGTAAGQDVTVTVRVDDTLVSTPLIGPASPDPFFYYKDGYYYYIRSSYGGLTVSKAKRFQDIGNVPRIMVYSQSDAPDYIRSNWWAPEIHYLDGDWYIYWAANDGRSENHRMYVLRSTDPDDAQAPYELVGQLAPTAYNEATGEWEVDESQDMWAIDGTVFENSDGRLYFLWAGYDGSAGNYQKLFIAEMLNPWTLKGGRTLISEPDLPFEKRGGGYLLNEGPQVIAHGDKIHVLYSACQANYDWYSLGLLTADADANLLDASSWTKSEGPLFTKSNNSADESFATGHAMVVQSPDGTEDWLIYHAYIVGNTSGHTGDMEERCTRVLKVTWDENDMPHFGNPIPTGELQAQPSGTPDAVALKYEAETAELDGNAQVTNSVQASGKQIVTGIDQNSSVTFHIDAPVAGRYLVSFMGNSRSASGHTGYQNVNINGEDYKVWHRGNNANVQNKWVPSCLYDSDQIGEGLYVDLPAGESTITVTYHPDSTANCDLDYLYLLLDDEGDYAVSLDKETMTLEIGQSDTLTATVKPEGDKVTFTSSNTAVATVDENGVVTAVSAGTAVITVRTASGAEASCTVTVTDGQTPAYEKGDLNKSGKVTIEDVMAACRIIARVAGGGQAQPEELELGDLNGNGRVDIADVMSICRIIARNNTNR